MTTTERKTPAKTMKQRREALQKANQIRTARAKFKKDLAAKEVRLVDALLSQPEYLRTMKVFDALICVPHYGRVKATKLMRDIKISHSKTIGGLSDRQRQELVQKLSFR